MKIEVSDGELVDKAAILKVKLERIHDAAKQANVKREYEHVMGCLADLGVDEGSPDFQELYAIHAENWELIETWNRKDRAGDYDDEYVDVTRRSNQLNRARFRVKSRLNRGSALVEEKSGIYDEDGAPGGGAR